MKTIQEALDTASSQIHQQAISDSPRLDAELLLAHCLGQTRTYLFTWPENTLDDGNRNCFEQLLQQRLLGHPVAHLIGEREFWGMALKVTPDTLIPRPDTEILVETALEKLAENEQACSESEKRHTFRILDLGTGTGAIALALKSECRHCEVTAVDLSSKALEVAKQNAKAHQLDIAFKQSSWFESIDAEMQFDLIVSNPPYIEEEDEHLSQGDVRFEPISALTAGHDGLDDLKIIIQQACSFLKPQGWLIVEHGYNQGKTVRQLFAEHGYQNVTTKQDYGGNPRITLGQRP
ncbi:peptide chain release factor N(5)-glutamine methyltransferase [Thiomicrorhabdus sp. ZW0627]|uniref:peptide chain release factor N(5)-glutamine methyltransferase n=1 Tax=Thiomicrorhabdus sp. ZW0627 TaxID=3039774 RepID=UPI002436543E|nr:peptide chain release factor N(5)-glutamine methyltransferase [Thiomicrorhabdus sp. ZW0627]MDG6774789.1 peptide chain release factor N(5)-glutamine methyltransferase [Thiomicrorhabdus sp. ZW0627]